MSQEARLCSSSVRALWELTTHFLTTLWFSCESCPPRVAPPEKCREVMDWPTHPWLRYPPCRENCARFALMVPTCEFDLRLRTAMDMMMMMMMMMYLRSLVVRIL